ncbi:MAG: GntR family transcriptional regulator [Pyrinomonadaceae bacterium]
MKFWISKNSEVSIREQIVTQVRLGVASCDLGPGEKLPSTREFARRFGIHANTVSAAYRELAAEGLVGFRKGSGVFVSGADDGQKTGRLEEMFSQFLDSAGAAGYSKREIEICLRRVLRSKPLDDLLVIESDTELRAVIIEEIWAATGVRAAGITFEEFSAAPTVYGSRLVAMFDEKEKLRPILPAGATCTFLDANSVPGLMSGRRRPSTEDLIAIVSGWEKFIFLAKLFLLAAKIEPDMLVDCLTTNRGWRKGAEQASIIICDSLSAKQFPDDARVRVFPLIAEASLFDVRKGFQR